MIGLVVKSTSPQPHKVKVIGEDLCAKIQIFSGNTALAESFLGRGTTALLFKKSL